MPTFPFSKESVVVLVISSTHYHKTKQIVSCLPFVSHIRGLYELQETHTCDATHIEASLGLET